MNVPALSITACMRQISTQLTTVALVTEAAWDCAEGGSEKALRMIRDLDERLCATKISVGPSSSSTPSANGKT